MSANTDLSVDWNAPPPDDGPNYLQAVTDMAERCQVVAHSAIYNANGIKLVEQGARGGVVLVVAQPDLGQALVGRQVARSGTQVLALNGGGHARLAQQVRPQGGDGDIRGLGQTLHGTTLAVCRAGA